MTHLSAGKILGRNVARLRRSLDLSEAVLADRLGWDLQTISALENGTIDLDIDRLDRLASVLSATPYALLENQCEEIAHNAERRCA